jgi:hypothetical protein
LTFEDKFQRQFEDSQRETQARMDLQKLEMAWPLIDKYISDFEKLAHLAGYNHTNPETMHYFMGRLPKLVMPQLGWLQPSGKSLAFAKPSCGKLWLWLVAWLLGLHVGDFWSLSVLLSWVQVRCRILPHCDRL